MATAEHVATAVTVLYHEPDVNLKRQAEQWLHQLRNDPAAWDLCWGVLSRGPLGFSSETQFFAANTLNAKVLQDFASLTQQAIVELRARIFKGILDFSQGPRIVFRQLCVMLASYIIQTGPPTWEDGVVGSLQFFQREAVQRVGPAGAQQALVEFASIVPEELTRFSVTMAVQSERLTRELVGLGYRSRFVSASWLPRVKSQRHERACHVILLNW